MRWQLPQLFSSGLRDVAKTRLPSRISHFTSLLFHSNLTSYQDSSQRVPNTASPRLWSWLKADTMPFWSERRLSRIVHRISFTAQWVNNTGRKTGSFKNIHHFPHPTKDGSPTLLFLSPSVPKGVHATLPSHQQNFNQQTLHVAGFYTNSFTAHQPPRHSTALT